MPSIQWFPAIAPVLAPVDPPVPQPGEEGARARGQRIGEAVQGLRQSAAERLPRAITAPSVDIRLRALLAVVGQPGTRVRRDVPAVGIVGIDGEAPGVVAVTTFVGRQPGEPAVAAPGGPAAARLIRAARLGPVPGQGMDVPLCARPVVAPGLASVVAAHQAAQLDPDQESSGVVGTGGDRPHVAGPGARREAPGRSGRYLLERPQLPPRTPLVPAHEQPAGLRPRVDGTVDRADRQREHLGLGKIQPRQRPGRGAFASRPRRRGSRRRGHRGPEGPPPGTASPARSAASTHATGRPSPRGGRGPGRWRRSVPT